MKFIQNLNHITIPTVLVLLLVLNIYLCSIHGNTLCSVRYFTSKTCLAYCNSY